MTMHNSDGWKQRVNDYAQISQLKQRVDDFIHSQVVDRKGLICTNTWLENQRLWWPSIMTGLNKQWDTKTPSLWRQHIRERDNDNNKSLSWCTIQPFRNCQSTPGGVFLFFRHSGFSQCSVCVPDSVQWPFQCSRKKSWAKVLFYSLWLQLILAKKIMLHTVHILTHSLPLCHHDILTSVL